ncbi:hypothetical protein KIN20_005153 [Parelaphostrongylus tenuis]|uniref:Uncharacterized protein n=1 Tax=Parelaphostrongylus tenuis TaxID=148309 RepID=A0AAD5LZM8_PARTN|nr:hypothetical protein KIN20_005153 [Parelaphostrongylus tenuis]
MPHTDITTERLYRRMRSITAQRTTANACTGPHQIREPTTHTDSIRLRGHIPLCGHTRHKRDHTTANGQPPHAGTISLSTGLHTDSIAIRTHTADGTIHRHTELQRTAHGHNDMPHYGQCRMRGSTAKYGLCRHTDIAALRTIAAYRTRIHTDNRIRTDHRIRGGAGRKKPIPHTEHAALADHTAGRDIPHKAYGHTRQYEDIPALNGHLAAICRSNNRTPCDHITAYETIRQQSTDMPGAMTGQYDGDQREQRNRHGVPPITDTMQEGTYRAYGHILHTDTTHTDIPHTDIMTRTGTLPHTDIPQTTHRIRPHSNNGHTRIRKHTAYGHTA